MDSTPIINSDLLQIAMQRASTIANLCHTVDNPTFWVHENLNIDLHDNQIEILDEVCDLNIKDIVIAQARGAGKTFAVAIGLIKLCLDYPGLKIGIFGPKADQSIRILSLIQEELLRPTMPIYNRIVWKDSIKSKLLFDNGSSMIALSADMSAMNEGHHFHIVVIDEAHQVEDIAVHQRIGPMLGSLPIGKMIKIGITMFQNHFWKSCTNPNYKVLIKGWMDCHILLQLGRIWYKGKEYPKRIVNLMPLKVKEELFPDRPDLHFEGEISDIDYKTQYAMEWVTDVNLELSGADQEQLVSGTHEILSGALPGQQEHYYFGLDTAPGSLMPGKKDLDSTVLSIWRKRGVIKEKVKCYEWKGDVLTQLDEIRQIIHPVTGKFPCKFGLVDFSNIATTAIFVWQKERIPVDGIAFGSHEPITGKNYKNAMFDQFRYELQNKRVFFSSLDKINTDVVMKKSFNEWCHIERHLKQNGINHHIGAPAEGHDDHCSADVLAVWAMDHTDQFSNAVVRTQSLPSLKINAVPPLMSRRPGGQDNRYLK
jgi:hypothetical protein